MSHSFSDIAKGSNSGTACMSVVLTPEFTSSFRMKKLLWEDVPNPKNCSWAQGVDFQQVCVSLVVLSPTLRSGAAQH